MTPLRWLTAPYAAILCANPNDLQVCSKLKMCRDRCQSSCVHNFHLCIEFSLVSNNCNSRLSFRATIDGSLLSDLRDTSKLQFPKIGRLSSTGFGTNDVQFTVEVFHPTGTLFQQTCGPHKTIL